MPPAPPRAQRARGEGPKTRAGPRWPRHGRRVDRARRSHGWCRRRAVRVWSCRLAEVPSRRPPDVARRPAAAPARGNGECRASVTRAYVHICTANAKLQETPARGNGHRHGQGLLGRTGTPACPVGSRGSRPARQGCLASNPPTPPRKRPSGTGWVGARPPSRVSPLASPAQGLPAGCSCRAAARQVGRGRGRASRFA